MYKLPGRYAKKSRNWTSSPKFASSWGGSRTPYTTVGSSRLVRRRPSMASRLAAYKARKMSR